MRAEARSAARVDLAGGTLDLWPLYLLHPGSLTVNFALGLDAVASAEDLAGSRVHLRSRDLDAEARADAPEGLDAEGPLSLLVRLVQHLRPGGGVRLETSSASPPGAGLGASSALAVAVVAALDALEGRRRPESDTVRVARDCETQALGFPAGSQDYWPGLLGGALALHWEIGHCRVESLDLPGSDLASRLALGYTGAPHHSGLSNWAVYKARIEQQGETRRHLEEIRRAAKDLRQALVQGAWQAAAEALDREWEHRKRLGPGVSTPLIDRLLAEGRDAGALSGKVCGAGGGGCVVFFCPEGGTAAVEEVFSRNGLRPLPVTLAGPLRIETTD